MGISKLARWAKVLWIETVPSIVGFVCEETPVIETNGAAARIVRQSCTTLGCTPTLHKRNLIQYVRVYVETYPGKRYHLPRIPCYISLSISDLIPRVLIIASRDCRSSVATKFSDIAARAHFLREEIVCDEKVLCALERRFLIHGNIVGPAEVNFVAISAGAPVGIVNTPVRVFFKTGLIPA